MCRTIIVSKPTSSSCIRKLKALVMINMLKDNIFKMVSQDEVILTQGLFMLTFCVIPTDENTSTKSDIPIKTYKSTVNILQLYNLAKLRKWKNKYTIQFLKVESPFTTYFGKAFPPYGLPPTLKMKKMPIPSKKDSENQKVPH